MILENDTPYNKPNTNERRSRITNPTPYSGLGKLPPQAVDLEEAVLGAIILESIPVEIWGLLKPEIFYKDNHQKICQAIINLKVDRAPVNLLSVRAYLSKAGELEMIGGAYYLTDLTNRVASSLHTEFNLLIITQKFLARELIRISTQVINNCYEDTSDPFSEMALLTQEISRLQREIYKRSEKTIGELLPELKKEREAPRPDGLIGISTGKKGLDHITKGDQPNQLRIKAARPAMGKTADMTSEILNCCFDSETQQPLEKQIPVGCFSLEMTSLSLVHRMLSNLSSISGERIESNKLSPDERIRLETYEALLADAPIIIDETSALTIDEFEAKAALWVAMYGVKKIYIDYLQLMLGSPFKKYANREAEISDISRRLKRVAKELGITVIALCQLSRAVEARKLCMPILSDLRESGSIEQDADIVEFLWRPEYYSEVIEQLSKAGGTIDIKLFDLKITEFDGLLISIVAKWRNGSVGKIPLKFKPGIMRIYDHPQVLDHIKGLGTEIFTPTEREGGDQF